MIFQPQMIRAILRGDRRSVVGEIVRERAEALAEVTRLRNAMGDVRGMQTDGATPEEMDRALAQALEGKPWEVA